MARVSKFRQISDAEQALRVELAAAFRLTHMMDWTMIVWNHISARVPGNEEHFLINPLGLRYDEITASKLVKVDVDGNVIDGDGLVPKPGFVIHSAVHRARDDVAAVMHTHTNDGIAVACLKDGLRPLSMEALYVYERLGYHGFEAASMDLSERDLIAQSLGSENVALILRHHGLLTTGRSVGECFTLMYFLQKACEIQMKVLASNAEYVEISEEMRARYAEQMSRPPRDPGERFDPGYFEWPALMRMLDGVDASYRD